MQSKKCKREIIMGYFGFSPLPLDTAHACCDYHEKLCSCDDCVLSDVASVMAPILTDEAPPLSNEDVYPYSELNMEQIAKLNEELVKFRFSLPGHGRTSVGSTSLSSGVTIKLIREVTENAHTFSSAEDIEKDFLSLAKVMPFQCGILLNNSFRKCEKQSLKLYHWFKIIR